MRNLKIFIAARADQKGTIHLVQSSSNLPECGHGTASGEETYVNSLETLGQVTCGRCKRTSLFKDWQSEYKRLEWIKQRDAKQALVKSNGLNTFLNSNTPTTETA